MPDRVSPARPAAHRRGRRRRPPAERFVYEQVLTAVAVPGAIVAVTVGAAAVAWRVAQLPAGSLLIGIACGVVMALLVGVWQARTAAGDVCRSQAQAAERLSLAVQSVDACAAWTTEELRRGITPPVPEPTFFVPSRDPYTDVDQALDWLKGQMAAAVIRASQQSRLAVRHAMFRHISRREYALVLRLLDALKHLQNDIEGAVLLDQVFQIDNMAVRIRRMVDSLAILGGESAHTVRHPVTLTTVLRGAIQETEEYARARVVASSIDPVLALPGHVAPDVLHLLAELVENATYFSSPSTGVQLRVGQVGAGLGIEVVDRDMPMPAQLRDQMNELLTSPELVDVSAQLEDGRIGLLVVGITAQRHGIRVTLNSNPEGGTTALVVIPSELLVSAEPEPELELAAPVLAPVTPRAAPMAQPALAASTAGGLPRRRTATDGDACVEGGPAARGRRKLPVRVPGPLAPADMPGPDMAVGAASVTANPGLAGAFRQGSQLSQQQGIAQPPSDPSYQGPGRAGTIRSQESSS
ncbi:signal transduction histidine kinase [Streptomyces umbrinus]|uniref:histidine kinase n=1 Tax=Streptomyces umbrinus TaxID=67370 RepID=A0ABU0T6R2_9ACTN|nr:ATP-binding protein [Streptomyces umbrinus]MDQ1031490.1 signal transduction histidine kinase [Streptomyces umbrinus]